MPGTTAVTLSSLSAGDYYGGKRGVDPDGAGGSPPYDFGTDVDVWNALGVPIGWRRHIAGVGYDMNGTSGAVPPGAIPPGAIPPGPAPPCAMPPGKVRPPIIDSKPGGSLGLISRNSDLPPVLLQMGFSMTPGEISDVIETKMGYHLIQVTEVAG